MAITNLNNDNRTPEHQGIGLSDRLKQLLPLSFRGQAVLFLFPMIVIISMVYTVESISTERKILRNEIIKKGETIATIAARNAELPLLSENLEQLKSSAKPLMEIKDVAFVSFINKRSEILLQEGKRYPLQEALGIDPDKGTSFSEHDNVFEFIVPVITVKSAEELFLLEGSGSAPTIKEQIGWVRIGLSKEVMGKSERQIMIRGGILAVVFSIAGVLLLYLFITLASRPLYALINAVKEVREGEHPEVRVVSPRSEIGQLSTEFNRMSRAIKEREEELAQTIDSLHHEIIERKRAEEELLRLARAIEQAAEAVFMSDAQWLITYVNPAFERMTGYAKDEIIGQHTRILKSGSHNREFYHQIRDILSRDNDWSGRITTRKKDGSVFEADTTVSSVRDQKDTIINYVGILRDVTHELKLERELRQSQKMEAIGTLAGGIAHDFNNILTAIVGYTDLALSKLSKDNEVTHDLERLQSASSRARELVSRILSFSRLSEQERRPVKIAPIVEEVLKLLRSTLPTTIEINQQIATYPDEDTVLADPTQIHQVLMNLGTNAAHAMRAEGGIFSVSLSDIEVDESLVALYPGLRQGPCVRLTVSDTGHGMEAGVKERIFDPYFTTKKAGEGTGMGLAVVRGIIKNLGGAISVYSEPGQGTTFHIFLPKFEGEIENPAVAEELPTGGTERILFVDDEAMLAELGKELLESLGYSVTVPLNSREALDLFQSNPQAFDLVVTDMTMPGLTGKELARELMSIRPDIPIILCTGFSELINEDQAIQAGIKGYILKPYAAKSLNKAIRRALA